MDTRAVKILASIIFQFSIIGILTYCLIAGYGEPDTIIGAFIGVLVGIGISSINEF